MTVLPHIYGEDAYEDEKQRYFGQLLSYDAARVSEEPEAIQQELNESTRRLEECIASNYKAYIKSQECVDELEEKLQTCMTCVDRILGDLPALQSTTERFREAVGRENAKREGLRMLYGNQSTVLDVLEIPSLMDTCVRGGHYEEALELKASSKKLLMVHGHLPIVDMIGEEVMEVSQAMMEQLLERLQSSIQLAECLKVVGYIRRLGVFSDQQLRTEFLERRGKWIETCLDELDSLNPYEYLKKTTDVHRLHVFDVVMQYAGIFSKDGSQEGGAPLTDPLYSWSYKHMMRFLKEVQVNLPHIQDGGSLASILDHCMYCGVALGRVGLDFRPALIPMFASAALAMFQRLICISDNVFKDMVGSHRWVALPSAVSRAVELSKKQDAEMMEDVNGDGKKGQTFEPPIVLVEHQPFAVYVNGILAAFNELRHCAPYIIQKDVAVVLRQSLHAVVDALVERESIGFRKDEKDVFYKACDLVGSVMFPFILECYSRLYGSPSEPLYDEALKQRVPHV